jgi:hypothetical protein
MRKRLPLALAAIALVIALFAATPMSEAAPKWVKRALFAKNANKVDGIHASSSPEPNRLLALDANGQFPASALPPGEETGAAYSAFRTGPVPLGGSLALIATLDLGPGRYVIDAKMHVAADLPTTVSCQLRAGADLDWAYVDLLPQGPPLPPAPATVGAMLPFSLVHEFTAPGTVSLLCNHAPHVLTFPGVPDIGADSVRVTATRVGALAETPLP